MVIKVHLKAYKGTFLSKNMKIATIIAKIAAKMIKSSKNPIFYKALDSE